MTHNNLEVQLKTSSLRNLRMEISDLEKNIFFNNFRWAIGWRDDFSWIYGLSEVEIIDFTRNFDNTKEDIKNIISVMESGKLQDKLTTEFNSLAILDLKEFILDTGKAYCLISIFRPIKKIRKSIKFKDILDDINRTAERMINLIENPEWLELEALKSQN